MRGHSPKPPRRPSAIYIGCGLVCLKRRCAPCSYLNRTLQQRGSGRGHALDRGDEGEGEGMAHGRRVPDAA